MLPGPFSTMILERSSIRLIQHIGSFLELTTTSSSGLNGEVAAEGTVSTKVEIRDSDNSSNENIMCTNKNDCNKNTRPSQPQSERRRVHFNLYLNQCYVIETVSSRDEIRERWFTPVEVKGFRSRLAAEGKRLTSVVAVAAASSSSSSGTEASFHQTLKNMFAEQRHPNNCNTTENSSSNNNNCVFLSPSEFNYVALLQEMPELLGMERFVLEAIHKDKGKRRRQQLIFLHELKRSNNSHGQNHNSNVEFVRLSCEAASQPSRALARRLAHIQAVLL